MARRKTHTEFVEQISGRKITALGIYKNSSTPMWFRCDVCENKWRARPNNVTVNMSGCPECAKKTRAMSRRGKNDWFINGDGYAVVDISTPKHIDVAMLIDKNDWIDIFNNPLIGRVSATKFGGQKRLYAEFVINGKRATVHRYLMGFPKMVDHINRDGLDNRRCNLRECNQSQNNMNKSRINNSSGRVGVRRVAWGWQSRIKVDGKEIALGSFDSFESAVKAREDAERKYFGEFA